MSKYTGTEENGCDPSSLLSKVRNLFSTNDVVAIRIAQKICSQHSIPYYFCGTPKWKLDIKYGVYSTLPIDVEARGMVYGITNQHPQWKVYKIEKRLRRR
jgi:hypothetical protein